MKTAEPLACSLLRRCVWHRSIHKRFPFPSVEWKWKCLPARNAGGTTAFASHAVKSSVRLAVNTSPEPASNVVVSLLEDVTVTLVVLLAVVAPWVAAAIALALLLMGVALIAVMWQGITRARAARRQRRGAS